MDSNPPRVRVEFYGVARFRAGCAEVLVAAATLGEALAAVDELCPQLGAVHDGKLAASYLVSLGGVRFTTDLSEPVAGTGVILFGADAGG